MFEDFSKKTVVVTGGTRGIGRGIAAVFASLGAKVCVIGRSQESGIHAQEEIKRSGGKALYCKADVKDRSSMKKAAEAVCREFGGVDVLCANAGIFPQAGLETISTGDWDEVMATNLRGVLFSVQAFLPALKESPAGRIILTSSITGPVTGYPGWSHYGASKAGMLGFMRTAAVELAAHRITINAILPGNVLTEGLKELGQDYVDRMASSIPLKRLGSVEEIGFAAAFLASERAGFITGQTLVADGGQTLPESLQAL